MIRQGFLCTALAALAACGSSQKIDPMQQVGPNPLLPRPSEDLLPRTHFPKVVGWKPGEAPSLPAGFTAQAMATGLTSPRNVYPLANGDILVVDSSKTATEPIERPKNEFFDYFFLQLHGTGDKPTNRIILLRDANGDGSRSCRQSCSTISMSRSESRRSAAICTSPIQTPSCAIPSPPGKRRSRHVRKSLSICPPASSTTILRRA